MTKCASAAAATCGAATVTPTTRAITPIKKQGTVRAAATVPPIGSPVDVNAAEANAALCAIQYAFALYVPIVC